MLPTGFTAGSDIIYRVIRRRDFLVVNEIIRIYVPLKTYLHDILSIIHDIEKLQ